MRRTLFVCLGLLMNSLPVDGHAEESPRTTPTVTLIQRIESAVVPIFAQEEDGSLGSGTGTVISEQGYILTADHVTGDSKGVVLFGLQRVPYAVVGRLPERDVAILKVDASHVKAVVALGPSHDLRAGEPILVGGNPSGRGIVFATGIVNSPSIDPSWPNILVKSYWRNEMEEAARRKLHSTGGRPDFIQFDASSNRGNSGGPLVNAEGQLIGVVAQKSFDEESINWAIPIDQIRMLMPYVVQPEEIGDFRVGLEVDALAERAVVKRVVEESPAWQAGIRADDVLVSVDGEPVSVAADWLFQLNEHKRGDQLEVSWNRRGETMTGRLALAPRDGTTSVTAEGRLKGLDYALYDGRFAALPDFSKLTSVENGVAESVASDGIVDKDAENFAIVFRGYVKFPDAGLYRLYLGSDDCSKLYVDDRLVIDNDLPHPYQELSRLVRVPQGLIPIRVEYSETSGDKDLKLFAKRDIESKNSIPLKFFRDDERP